jgi:hypothetical protein
MLFTLSPEACVYLSSFGCASSHAIHPFMVFKLTPIIEFRTDEVAKYFGSVLE